MVKKIIAGIVRLYRALTHHRPDLDELFSLWQLCRFAKELYPGLAEAPIETIDAGLSLKPGENGDRWLDQGYVVIGVLGGRLDEHGKGDGKSAASLTAEFLGLTENPGLIPMLAYAVEADDKATDAPFNMARIIKDMHSAGVPLEKVRGIVDRWLDSLYAVFSDHFEPRDRMMTIKQIAINWFLERFRLELTSEPTCTFQDVMDVPEIKDQLTDEMIKEIEHIQKYLDEQMDEHDPFSLAGLAYAMQMAGAPDAVVIEDMRYALNAKVFVQRQFMAAIDDFASNATFLDNCPLKVAVIRSDNEQMNRAARATLRDKLDLLVQVRSTGHVQIFSDHRRDLRPILGRLRVAEERKSGRNYRLSNEQLASGGTLPQIRQWFGFEKYGSIIAIFNGTVKTRRVPKTNLTMGEVLGCVRDGLAQTHRARGVKRDRREEPIVVSAEEQQPTA